MGLKYKCLVLDHDDTAVDSTSEVHYPAHVEIMRVLRPGIRPLSLNGWFKKNFHPGIMHYLTLDLKMNPEELEQEFKIWRSITSNKVPSFFPGFLDTLTEFKRRGGIVTVVSHSEEDIIKRHYMARHIEGKGPLPDLVFGWDHDETRRKPSPYPIKEIQRRFSLKSNEMLIVDDLKPGIQMGLDTGVPAAGAGWSHDIPEIKEYMKNNCVAYFSTVEEFKDFVL